MYAERHPIGSLASLLRRRSSPVALASEAAREVSVCRTFGSFESESKPNV